MPRSILRLRPHPSASLRQHVASRIFASSLGRAPGLSMLAAVMLFRIRSSRMSEDMGPCDIIRSPSSSKSSGNRFSISSKYSGRRHMEVQLNRSPGFMGIVKHSLGCT